MALAVVQVLGTSLSTNGAAIISRLRQAQERASNNKPSALKDASTFCGIVQDTRLPTTSPLRVRPVTHEIAVLGEKHLFPTHFSSSFPAGHGKSQTRLSHALSIPGALRKRDH
jgi:hypothetical protein